MAKNSESPLLDDCQKANVDSVFQINGNVINSTKKINSGRIKYSEEQPDESSAAYSLGYIKTGYKTTMVGVYAKITLPATELSNVQIFDFSGNSSLAILAAGVAALAISF